jgi:hypothetical protein
VGQDLPLVEAEEALLIGADLRHVDLLVAGIDVLLDRLEVALRVGPAGERLDYVFLVERRGGLL